MAGRNTVLVFLPFLLAGASAMSGAAPLETRELDDARSMITLDDQLARDRSVVWFGGVDTVGEAVEGGTWDFSDGTLQGWVGIVPAFFDGSTRRVVAADFASDPASPMFPAPSTAQIWCGLHESEADARGWVDGMGYGNDWCQNADSPVYSISTGNSITLGFKYITDCEYDMDVVYVQILTYNGAMTPLQTYTVDDLTGENGTPSSPLTFSTTVPYSSFNPAPSYVRLRFRFESDGSWSDEDGLYDSVFGAFSFDDVTFTIGTVPHPFDFESGEQGWTLTSCGTAPIPSQTGVIDSATYTPWLTAMGVTSCTLSGNVLESTGEIPAPPDFPMRPHPQWEDLVSPVINRGTHTEPVAVLRFDMYFRLPHVAATFWRVAHSYSTNGGVSWTPVTPLSDFWTYSPGPTCGPLAYVLTQGSHPIASNWNRLRVVIQLATDCDGFGVDPCTPGDTKGSPLFDNIRVGLSANTVRTCCLDQNACSQMTEVQCLALGGTWFPDLTTCTPNPCGQAYLIKPDGSGDYPTISAALSATYDGDTLVLGNGTFTGAGNRDLDFAGKAIVMESDSGDPALCAIDCEELGRGFVFDGGEDSLSVVSGVTIKNGRADRGGGIYCSGSSPKFTQCLIEHNYAEEYGGGIYCTAGSAPRVVFCAVRLNEARLAGGGLASDSGSHPCMYGCVFDHNVTQGEGACLSTAGSMPDTLMRSVLVFGLGAEAVSCGGVGSFPWLACCDVYGNEGGDYTGCIADQAGTRNNFSADPLFCSDGNPTGIYAVTEDSPCAPENNPECGLVGMNGIGCATLTVDPGGGGEYTTIQAAADAAADGDLILLEPGIYVERSSSGISMRGKPIIIRTQSRGRQAATLDCQGTKRGFIFDMGEGPGSMIDGIRIINGSELYGGAVLCSTGTSPSLHECLFESNRADLKGGGVCVWGGSSPFIEDCTFQSDTAAVGGGIALLGDASPLVERCRFIDCVSTDGGGAYVEAASPVILNSCTFDGNAATNGGGVYCGTGASPTLFLCTLIRNSATSGGGIYSASTLPVVERSIIAFAASGGAVAGGPVTLACSDIYGNTGGDWTGAIAEQSGWSGNFSLDPRFCDLENDDVRIWNHSPCNIVSCGPVGAWPVGCTAAMPVDPDTPEPFLALPRAAAALPNPFAGSTEIRYIIPQTYGGCRVQIRVFDLGGRLVRSLLDVPQVPGSYGVTWDGRDNEGEAVPSGVYYCRVRIGGWEATKTTLRVK